jgi:hypothetical protein
MSRPLLLVTVLILAVGCSGSPRLARPEVTPGEEELIPPPKQKPSPAGKQPTASIPTPSAPVNPSAAADNEAGVISGVVRWSGAMPGTAPASRPDDLSVTVNGRKVSVTPTPRLLIDPESKGVANVAVWLVRAPAFPLGEGAPAPPSPVRLTQREGNFVPHVLVARQGTELQLGTGDDEADFQTSGAVAVSVRLTRGQLRSLALSRTGLVEVRSESRPWMTPAFVHVLEHEYHAVTGPDGRFRLPAVPRGEYEIMLWHEGWRPGAIEPVRARVRINLEQDRGAAVQWLLSNP